MHLLIVARVQLVEAVVSRSDVQIVLVILHHLMSILVVKWWHLLQCLLLVHPWSLALSHAITGLSFGWLYLWLLLLLDKSFGQFPATDTLANRLGIHIVDRLSRLSFAVLTLSHTAQTFWERVLVDVVLVVVLRHRETTDTLCRHPTIHVSCHASPVLNLILLKSCLVGLHLIFHLEVCLKLLNCYCA